MVELIGAMLSGPVTMSVATYLRMKRKKQRE